MSEIVRARVVAPHQHVGDVPHYHEWVNSGRKVAADRRGYSHPGMSATWQKWICNNPDCWAVAYVNEAAIQNLIEAAS